MTQLTILHFVSIRRVRIHDKNDGCEDKVKAGDTHDNGVDTAAAATVRGCR